MLGLVVTADDLGIDARRDDGIFEAFAQGAITQASLMVTGPTAAAAAARARQLGLPLGLHLDLTEGEPCAPRDEIASLLDETGGKRGKRGFYEAAARGAIRQAHVAREASAQLARFMVIARVPARHADGHQHVHVIPELADTIAWVFAEAGVETIRIPEQRGVAGDGGEAHCFYERVSRSAAAARTVYARRGIVSTETFVGLDLLGTASSVDALREAVRVSRWARSVELMCHPGHAGTGWDDFNRSPAREHELAVMLAKPFHPLVEDGVAYLATFAALHANARLAC